MDNNALEKKKKIVRILKKERKMREAYLIDRLIYKAYCEFHTNREEPKNFIDFVNKRLTIHSDEELKKWVLTIISANLNTALELCKNQNNIIHNT
jgi:hypothetical protein